MRELQLMFALESAGTSHYSNGTITKKDGAKSHVYFLTNMNENIKEKLDAELSKIKGMVWSYGKSQAEYAPEQVNPILIRESFH